MGTECAPLARSRFPGQATRFVAFLVISTVAKPTRVVARAATESLPVDAVVPADVREDQRPIVIAIDSSARKSADKPPRTPRSKSARGGDDSRAKRATADRQLVDRCLAGDGAAWNALYNQVHPGLLLAIQVMLGGGAYHYDLVDDIAAKVWFIAIDHDGALLRKFDGNRRCRLSTYLAGIAKKEISRHFRSERRRTFRETHATQHRAQVTTDSHWQTSFGIGTALAEFMATLTPREREFCQRHLLSRSETLARELSPANRWQLQHRVRSKLWEFLDNA